jgi:hypothetical protein
MSSVPSLRADMRAPLIRGWQSQVKLSAIMVDEIGVCEAPSWAIWSVHDSPDTEPPGCESKDRDVHPWDWKPANLAQESFQNPSRRFSSKAGSNPQSL